MWNAWIVGLLGIWMVIAPFLTMPVNGNTWNDWAIGVITIALGLSLDAEHAWQKIVTVLLGIWMLLSGFLPVLSAGRGLQVNDVAVGVLLIIVGLSAVGGAHHIESAPPHQVR